MRRRNDQDRVVTVRIPDDLIAALDAMGRQTDRTRSACLRVLAAEGLAARGLMATAAELKTKAS